jgi:hypothetical protein
MLHVVASLTLFVLFAMPVRAQQSSSVDELLRRLNRLEEENRRLQAELQDVHQQLLQMSKSNGQAAGTGADIPISAGSQQSVEEPERTVRWSDLIAGESRFKFYGLLRLDIIRDSARPDNSQKPFFTLPAADFRASQFTLHPRLTRLGADFSTEQASAGDSPPITGKFEIDFQNGGLESRQVLRIRHAYLKINRKHISVLAGQTWDMISPLNPTVNNDTLMWNAGNLGDRRPQLRFETGTETGRGRLDLAGGIALGGATDAADLDGDGFRDAESSGRPNFQSRLGYRRGSTLNVGVWGHRGWQRAVLSRPVLFPAHVFGADFDVTLNPRLRLSGEAWKGSNLSDIRGGVGQGLNKDRRIPIRSEGGWLELGMNVQTWNRMAIGYSLDDPINRDLSGGIERNRAWYWAHRFFLAHGLELGLDYIYWSTDFQKKPSGLNHRTNFFMQYRF